MTKLEKEIRDMLVERIEDLEDYEFEDNSEDSTELVFYLFETENVNGSFSGYEAKDWIKEHFEDLDVPYSHYVSEYGTSLNPFEYYDKFMVCMVIFIAEELMGELWQLWEDEEATKDNVLAGLKNL